jgi:AcrR family transcriptional regulator
MRKETIVTKRQLSYLPKAQKTRKALLQASEGIFSERGYHVASVSEICQRAGLANGTFYRYFGSKEEVFVALVERLQAEMCEQIEFEGDDGKTGPESLICAYRRVLAYVEKETTLYRVGRGAESMQMEIHRHFRTSIADALQRIIRFGIQTGDIRPIDPCMAAYVLVGVIEFTAMRYILWEPESLNESVLQTLDSFILRGFDSGAMRVAESEQAVTATAIASAEDAEELQGGEATKQSLLTAAERLFGQAGFYQTPISGITYLSGVAQGTFYLHFPSKVAIFVELVREINRRFRADEQRALIGLEDRRDVERQGFRTFFQFIGMHPGAYRILREAELVDHATGRWYYERLAKGYMRGLCRGMERGEIRSLALEPLAYTLLGIGHSVALWILFNGAEGMVSESRLADLLDILEHGISVHST